MSSLGEHLDGCTFLRGETDDVVARVKNGGGWNLHLGSRLESLVTLGRQFIETSGLKGDSVDLETGFIAFDEVNRDLGLLHHLVTRAWTHLFDGRGDVLGIAACRGALKAHDDEE